MKRLNNANKNYYIPANTILSLTQRASEIFENSEIEEKKQLRKFHCFIRYDSSKPWR